MSAARRLGLVVTAFLVAAVGLVGPGSGLAAAQDAPATTGAPKTPSGDPAIDDLVGCVQGSQELLVLFIIDESASLKQTDPDNQRVDAARSALDSLVALATTEGDASPEVEVALAAFSNEYRLVKDWTPAGDDTAKELRTSLDGFAKLHDGIDTDFVNALSAGREALADKSAEVTTAGGDAPCRAVLLFTDGGFDIAVRTSAEDRERLGITKPYAPGIELTDRASVAAAEAAGRRALCKPDGLADRLRNDDVTLLTVALSRDVARRSQLPLAAATAGKADDYTCGSETSRPRGAYLPADGLDVLVTRFNEVGTRLAGGNLLPGENTVKVCGSDVCDEGSRTFRLDETLRRAQILALPSAAGAEVELRGPEGGSERFKEAGTATVSGAEVVVREIAGRGLTLDLRRDADAEGWDGDWTVTILDPSGDLEGKAATLQVFVFSDIGVELSDSVSLVRGEEVTVTATLEAPKGVKIASVVADAEVVARFRNPITDDLDTVSLTGPPEGPFTGTYTPPASTTANALEAVAEARITTETGASLTSQSGVTEMLVRRPGDAIQYAPATLKMPSLEGDGVTETVMVLLGGETDGCVWFGSTATPDAPSGAGSVAVTVDDAALPKEPSCIAVPARKQVTVTVQATVKGKKGSGTVNGTLEVFERTKGSIDPSTTQVAFRFDLARKVDQARRLMFALLLLAVGLGIPMVALLVINALTARFQSLDAVRGTTLRVLVSDRGVQRIDGGYPKRLVLNADDFGSLADTGTPSRFTFGGIVFRARASRNPFGATIALAAPEGGAEKLKGNEGSRVELDPALAGSWIFLLDADATRRRGLGEAEGQLIAFVAEGEVRPQAERMLPDISARLPAIADRLAGLVRQKKSVPAKQSGRKRRAAASAPASSTDAPDDEAPDDSSVGAASASPEAIVEPAGTAVPLAEPGPAEPAVDADADDEVEVPDDPEPDDSGGAPPIGFTGGPRR